MSGRVNRFSSHPSASPLRQRLKTGNVRSRLGSPWTTAPVAVLVMVLMFAGAYLAGRAVRDDPGLRANSPLAANAVVSDGVPFVSAAQVLTDLQVTTSAAPLIIDVRTSEEFTAAHIADAVNVPESELLSSLERLPRDRVWVLYCTCPDDLIAKRAFGTLERRGYTNVVVLAYGLSGWEEAGGTVTRLDSDDAPAHEGCGCSNNAEAEKLWIVERQETDSQLQP